MKKCILIITICLFSVIFARTGFAETADNEITMGIIITHMAVSPTAILEGCRPFAKYMSDKLGMPTKVEIIPDVNTMLTKLDTGSIDFGYVSNLDYVKLKKERNITPITKVVKGGTSTYNALLLVRKDSGINTLADLKGKSIAFTSKNSSHGYLYPSILVKENFKMPLEQFFGKVITTKKDPDGILSVLYKRADAVSASSQTYNILCLLMPRIKRDLKVISTSQPFVHGPMFTYEKNVKNKTIIANYKKHILDMDKVTEGKQVLLLFKIGGWTTASDTDYTSLRQMLSK